MPQKCLRTVIVPLKFVDTTNPGNSLPLLCYRILALPKKRHGMVIELGKRRGEGAIRTGVINAFQKGVGLNDKTKVIMR